MEEFEEKAENAERRAQETSNELRDANEKVNMLLNRNTELKMQLQKQQIPGEQNTQADPALAQEL